MTNIEFLRSEVNGVEYFTLVATGESGMSQRGLARACGIVHKSLQKLVLNLATKSPSKRLERFVGMNLNLATNATKRGGAVVVYKSAFCSAVIKYYASKGNETAGDFDDALGDIGLTSYIQGVTGWLPQQFQSSPAARQKLSHILDAPTPWVKLYEREFCTKVYTWFGPNFYWTFCYSFLTPVERCKVELLNPVVNGERAYRIHQYLEAETRDRLTPHIWQLLAIVNTATDRRTFLAGYQKHFEGTSQLELF